MNTRLVIPCLRGFMGSWTTYSCMMQLSDVRELIGFAHELHNIKKLSDKIQRELNANRAEEISKYLLENKDRFFNSLVVGIYDGDPNWHNIGKLRPDNEEATKLIFPDYAGDCLGFLSITKKEKFFALDGQHRLAGIKLAINQDASIGKELINVIIVAHYNTPEGKIRSRRLFTTLNKKAKLVGKDAIIALDEDDISACITRKLIESDKFPYFNEDNVSFASGPVRDKTSITSIVNIYDNIQKLVAHKMNVNLPQLDKYVYNNNTELLSFVNAFFEKTFEYCEVLSHITRGKALVSSHRDSNNGGHLLLRPIGWDIYTDVVINALSKNEHKLNDIIKMVHKNDLSLSGPILLNKVWSQKNKRILKVSSKSYKAIEKSLLS